MSGYKLIGRDQMEPTLLRRKLDPWGPAKAVRVRPLIETLFLRLGLNNLQIKNPCWEANVYPLYYYYFDPQQKEKAWAFKRILQESRRLFCDSCGSIPDTEFYLQTCRMADAEIDLLIEDEDYFIFVEAKTSLPGKQIKFGRDHGVHQLVWQYAQGLFLQKASKNGSSSRLSAAESQSRFS
ncbi:MAG: hypothetical protein HY695_13020 [Deltaproteobacteria bacterium]|nr:hypothetical protein [Deltaproteobacteria bacterium]